jgi:hypothetical protein
MSSSQNNNNSSPCPLRGHAGHTITQCHQRKNPTNKPIPTLVTCSLKPLLHLLSNVQAATSLRLQPLKHTSQTSFLPLLLQKILICMRKMLISTTSSKKLTYISILKLTTAPPYQTYRDQTCNWLLSQFLPLNISSYLDSSFHSLSREKAECSIHVSSSSNPFLFEPLDYCKHSHLTRSFTWSL